MKLTMTCNKCGATFDEGLVFEISDQSDLSSIDLVEFMDNEFACATCGHKEKISSVVPMGKNERSIY